MIYKIIVTPETVELDRAWTGPRGDISPLDAGELQDLAAQIACMVIGENNSGTKVITIDFTKENCVVVTNE